MYNPFIVYGALASLLKILKKLLCPLPTIVDLTKGCSGDPNLLVPKIATESPKIEGVAEIILASPGCSLSKLSKSKRILSVGDTSPSGSKDTLT